MAGTTIEKISAGTTVSKFLEDLNDNFDVLNNSKQNKIFTAMPDSTIKIDGTDYIKIVNGIPSGGTSGDIVIVYE